MAQGTCGLIAFEEVVITRETQYQACRGRIAFEQEFTTMATDGDDTKPVEAEAHSFRAKLEQAAWHKEPAD
jgi:hypothetical protein